MRRGAILLALSVAAAGLLAPAAGHASHCTPVSASPTSLWPPNHKFHTITLTAPAGCDVDITSVTQDEAVDMAGSGHTVDFDARSCVDDPPGNPNSASVDLRAERSGQGNGRVYTIEWTSDNGSGQPDLGTSTVAVPHDHSKKKTPVDDMSALPSGVTC